MQVLLLFQNFNENGSIESVKVTAGGEGFTQMPDVYIKSETGFNAELRPVFCIDRIAKDEVKEYDPKGKSNYYSC